MLPTQNACSDSSQPTIDELGLDTIWQPPWDEIWISQVTIVLSLLVLQLHFRLYNVHEVTEVLVEEFHGSVLLKIVPIVKYGVKTV